MVALSRRYFVGGAAALGTTALWPARLSLASTGMGCDEARHLLSRATFGATQSRFDAVIANLQQGAEAQSAARSRIMDADFASETANLIARVPMMSTSRCSWSSWRSVQP